MSQELGDIPTEEEISSYFGNLRMTDGVSFYNDQITASRLAAMGVLGRKIIMDQCKSLLLKSGPSEKTRVYNKEMIKKAYLVALSIPFGKPQAAAKSPSAKDVKRPKLGIQVKPFEQVHGLYYDVTPVWKRDAVPIATKSEMLGFALKECFESLEDDNRQLEEHFKALSMMLSFPYAGILNRSESGLQTFFRVNFSGSCLKFFNAVGFKVRYKPSIGSLCPNVVMCDADDTVLMICEIVPGLSNHLDDNGQLLGDEPGLKPLLKRVCVNLIKSKLTFCLISDCETTIVVELDLSDDESSSYEQEPSSTIESPRASRQDPASSSGSPERACQEPSLHQGTNGGEIRENNSGPLPERKVPFKYKVIGLSETKFTLQEAFYSLVHHQYRLDHCDRPDLKLEREAQIRAVEKLEKSLKRPKSEIIAERSKWMRVTCLNNITSNYKNVRLAKYEKPLIGFGPQWEDKNYDLLSKESDLTKVCLFDADDLAQLFPALRDRVSVHETDEKVVLKLYDLDHIEDSFKPFGYTCKSKAELRAKLTMDYFREVECYERITQHNYITPARWINIPEIHDYGWLIYGDKNSFLFEGFYILMSYVKHEPRTIRKHTFEHGHSQLKTLGELGISHLNINEDNLKINRSEIYFSSFHGCSDAPVSNDDDALQLERVETKILRRGATSSDKKCNCVASE